MFYRDTKLVGSVPDIESVLLHPCLSPIAAWGAHEVRRVDGNSYGHVARIKIHLVGDMDMLAEVVEGCAWSQSDRCGQRKRHAAGGSLCFHSTMWIVRLGRTHQGSIGGIT